MKNSFASSFGAAACCALAVSTLGCSASAQNAAQEDELPSTNPNSAQNAPSQKTVRGQAFFLERIALAPGAMLHVSLVGRVAGAEYLPLATTLVPARNGTTPFELRVPAAGVPAGPYRLQAWIIGDNRLMMVGRDAQTSIGSLDEVARIRLKIVGAPQNIDGIGDGKPLRDPLAPINAARETSVTVVPRAAPVQAFKLRGTVSKLDRRAISPDARMEVQLRDVSLADAPATVVLGQAIQLDGQQLPRAFSMALLPSDLKVGRRYTLSAQVFENGKMSYLTKTPVAVSLDNYKRTFQVRVVPAP